MRLRALGCALGLSLSVAAQGQVRPLFVVPTEGSATQAHEGAALRVALYARDPAELARILGATPPSAPDRLEYTFAAYPQLPSPARRSWLESTFVIDFEEPEAMRLYRELQEASGEDPSRLELVAFASGAIESALDRGFDVASIVARNRRGDCTEHAVTVAALARANGVPARVVLGLALVSKDGRHDAYGHAWAEVQESGRWVVADSALSSAVGEVRYLPFGVLAEEGPGYVLELARLTQVWVQRLVVL